MKSKKEYQVKKNTVFIKTMFIAFIALCFIGCKHSSDDTNYGDNLKDVIQAGEDLSGNWKITKVYMKLYSEKDGVPSPDNIETSDINTILNYDPEDKEDKIEIGLDDLELNFATKEEAAEYFMQWIEENETAVENEKQNFESQIMLIRMFGGNISKSKSDIQLHININDERNVIIYEKKVNDILKGSMLGQSFDAKMEATVTFNITKQEQ